MAHRQAKQQAFELFQKGFYPQDVAASLNINVRTCQRWFREFQADNVATSQPQKSGARSPVLVEDVAGNSDVITNEDDVIPSDVQEVDEGCYHTQEELDLVQAVNRNCQRLCKEDSSGIDKKFFGNTYVNFLERLTYYHLLSHASIRVKIQDLLNAELAKPEVNLRSVEKLSLALSRHITGEREAANVELLDVNRAAARLTNGGFEIAKFPDDYDN